MSREHRHDQRCLNRAGQQEPRVCATKRSRAFAQWLIVGFAATVFPVYAQVCGTPGKDGPGGTLTGAVNTYYAGGGTGAAAGATSITLGTRNASGGTTDIALGDLLLVIQMQGASLNSTDTNAYGDGTAGDPASGSTINNSGLYEYVTATSPGTAGNPVSIRGEGTGNGLLNTYTNANATTTQGQQRYQVVRVPQYSSATLSATLTAARWNGASGGILAIDVAGTLTLGGTVDVSGFGFRGAGGVQLTNAIGAATEAIEYRTNVNAGTANDAGKGEGIAGTPRYVNNNGTLLDNTTEGYPNGSAGFGAPGNAGGGGTNDTGGGGGGNGGAGGRGGDNWSPTETTASQRHTNPEGGFGGAAFPGTISRVVMGGGGGAGANHNLAGAHGGAGGGIVLIRAGNVTGTGTIQSNGANAPDLNSTGNAGDTGGGGAGGTVVVVSKTANSLSGLTVNTAGGNGGNVTGGETIHAAGGAGAGGLILLSSPPAASNNGSGLRGTSPAENNATNGTTTQIPATFLSQTGSGASAPVTTATPANTPGTDLGAGCVPALTVTKTTSTATIVNTASGTTATYTITVANAVGKADATQVAISDMLPSGFTYASGAAATLNGSASGPASPTNAGSTSAPSFGSYTIPGGDSVAITMAVNVASSVTNGTYNNSATATYLDPTRTTAGGTTSASFDGTASNTDDVTVVRPPTITKTFNGAASTSINTNAVATLGIVITNPNTVAISSTAFSDPFPGTGLVIVSSPAAVNSCSGTLTATVGTSTLSLSGGAIAAGSSCAITVSVSSSTGGTYNNTTGAVTGQVGAINLSGNTGSATLIVNQPPIATNVTNASIAKTAGPTTLSTGLAATDADGTIASYTVSTLPPAVQGVLYLADGVTAATAGQVLTPAQAAGLKFDPTGTFVGNVSFTYTATDNQGIADATPATYTIPVTNLPPTANNVTNSTLSNAAGPTTILPLAATDADGTIVSYTVSTLPSGLQGVLYLADGTTAVTAGQVLTPAQASSLKFDPAALFVGNATFTFTATDDNGAVDASPATYTIPVDINQAPVANNVTSSSIPSSAGPTSIAALTATDNDGTIASYTVSSLPPAALGKLYLADGVTAVTSGQVLTPAQASSLKFDPSGTFNGNVTFQFTATDDVGASDLTPATYTIPVTNTPPSANDVTASSVPSSAGPTTISALSATDSDGTIASYTVSTLPPAAQGVLYLADGTTAVTAGQVLTPAQAAGLKFDPSGTTNGNITFTFTATDNQGGLDATPATYTIPVTNTPPTATDVTNASIPSTAGPTTISSLAATDADGTITSYTVSTLPTAAQGILYLADGTTAVTAGQVLTPAQAAGLKFDPSGTFTGNSTFTFTATDNNGAVDATPATFTIPVGNNPPTANNVTASSIPSTAGPTTISALSASDTDGTIASYTVSTLPPASQGILYLADGTTAVTAGQVLTPAQAAGLKFDPSGTFTGNSSFTFTATDNNGAVDATPATYTIPISNNPPVATNVTNASIPSTAGATTISSLAATDTDGTISSYSVSTLPTASQGILYLSDGTTAVTAGQVLTPAQAAGLKFDPSGSYTGNSSFTFTATDNNGAVSNTATYTILVGNNPPVANTVTNASIPSTAGPTTLSTGLAATDSDGTIASYTVSTLPTASQGILYLADGTTAVTAGQVLTPAQAAGLKFDPSGTFTGNSSFTYIATDNSGAVSNTATYTIPVGNNPPVANDVTNPSISVGASPTTISSLSATDSDGTISSYMVSTLPTASQGILYLADGTTAVTAGQVLTPAQASSLKFDPSGNFAGNASFTYTATDNNGVADATPATFTIPLTNAAPTANDVTASSVPSSAGPTTISALSATDSDGTIASYTVSTLPPASQGILYLTDGVTAVTAGQVLTPAQASSLKFDPSGTFTGNATFTFTATDNLGAVDATPATYTIPVGNNPPTANDVTNASINANAGPTTISSLSGTDTDGTISSYTISTLPTAAQGILYLSDGTTAVTAGQLLTPAQAAGLKFDPSGNFSGNATFTFTATDNSGSTDATPATFTIPLTNAAPVANNVTASSVPSSAGPTTISALAATDSDGTISSYTVSTLPPAAQGILYLADGVTAVTAGQVLTPAQASSLKFDPSGTFNGSSTFTFTATDNTGGVDATPATYTIPVSNTPPVANDVTNATSIPATSGPTTISSLSATDLDGTIASYTVSTLPPAAQGVLYLADGVTAVTAGQALTPAQASSLKFDPSGTFNGNVTFTYTATDNQGAVDATPATFTIPLGNIPPVTNDVTNAAISVAAGPTTISGLSATDSDGTIASYTISTLPTASQGILYLADGTTVVTAGQVLTLAQAAGLKFDPSGTFVGNASFTYTATDNNGSSDASPATFTIPVTNTPPTATDVTNASIPSTAGATTISSLAATDTDGTIASYTVSTLPPATQGVLYLADGVTAVTAGQVLTPAQASSLRFDPSGTFTGSSTFTFTATDNNGATDATPAAFTIPVGNNSPVAGNITNASIPSTAGATTLSTGLAATDTDGTITSYTVSTLPTASQGILYLADGVTAVTAGQVLTPAQAAGLKFDPSGTYTGNSSFTFTATDSSGAVSNTATYTIPVGNNPPGASTVTNASIPSTAGATTLSTGLAATDTDGTISSYTVSTLPTASQGILYLADGTTAVTAGQVLTPAQAAGLKFDPSGTYTGNSSFTYTATDNNGAVSNTATYTIPVGNNPPTANTITNASIPSTAGATTLSTGLAATDTDGTITSYTVSTLPPAAQGVLYLADGTTAVTTGQLLTPAQAAGLKFDPSGTFTGNSSFTYTATDNSGAVSNTATYTIPVGNNPPTANDVTNAASIPSTAGATTISALAATDSDGTIASYTVSTLPTASQGILYLADGTTAVTAGQVLTPAQASSLKFDPSGTFNGNVTFQFTATDNSGVADATPATFTIPVGNNPPVTNNVTASSVPSSAGPTTISALAATDSDGTISSYTVSTLPPAAQGILYLADGVTAVTAGQVLTPAQASSLKFDPSGTFNGSSTFTFTATDNQGAVDATPATYTIPVSNTAPTATDVTNAASIPSTAGATTISALAATDSDGTIASYTVSTLPTASQGILYLADGTTAVTAGQVLTPAQASSLKFDPSGTFTGNATFTFTATDNNGATDATPATFTIPVGNNPPVAADVTNPSISVGAGPTTISSLSATDSDGTISSYTISTLPTAAQGVLYLADGVTAVTAGQVLTSAQASSLKFDPSGNFAGNASFTYTATDNNGVADATPATFTIPLTNAAPTANDVTASSVPSSAGPTTISALSATDSDGTIASYTVSTLPPASQGILYLTDGVTAVTAGQVLTPAQASSLKFDPSGTFTGNATFTFTATDNLGAVDATPATYTIPVGNNPPTATDTTNAASIPSTAGATTISSLAATDSDGTISSYTISTLPTAAQGILYLADGTTAVTAGQVLTPAQASSLKFDPSGTFTGDATFTFTATDNSGSTDATPATYTIPVGNNPPTANNVTASSLASSVGPTTIAALSATDSDGTISSYTVSTLPAAAQGILYLADGTTAVTAGQVLTPAQASSLKFDPSGTFNGNSTFTFTATDNIGATDSTPASFTIPVSNTAPTANDVANTAGIPSTAGPTTISSLSATDLDGTIASYTVSTLPPAAQGVLYLADGVTAVTAGQVLTPAQAAGLKFDPSGTFTGNATFTFTATDNQGAVDATPATFTIPIGNNPPTANNVTGTSIPSNAGPSSIGALSATDTDGTIANYVISSLPSSSVGILYYPDGTTPVQVGDVLTPAQAAGLKFDPSGTTNGNASFTFTAIDDKGAQDGTPATFTIPLGNTPPTATDVNGASIPSSAGPTTIGSLAATDPDGTIASYTVSTLPPASQGILYLADGVTAVTAGQVLTPAQAAGLKFDPTGTYTGNVTFSFTATDNNGATDATPATYTIPAANTPPVANDVTSATVPNQAGPTAISSLTATDADGTIASYTISTLPAASQGILYLSDGVTAVAAGQTLTPAQAAGLKFDPASSFDGNASFTYTATDNLGAADATPATISIPVLAPLSITKAFASSTVSADGAINLSITLSNPNSVALTGAAFTDTFPSSLAVANAPTAAQCSGTVSGTSGSVSLSGGRVPANGTCTITVSVKSALPGPITNTIPAGAVTTANGGSSTSAATSTLETASVGAAKSATVTNNGDGTYSISYLILVENLGSAPLSNVQLEENLGAVFTGTAIWTIQSGPTIASGAGVTLNPGFTGRTTGSINLLSAASSTLAVGAKARIAMTVRVNPNGNAVGTSYANQVKATATGNGPGGANIPVTDLSSNSGSSSDPNGNGNPNDPGEDVTTTVNFTENPVIGAAKLAGAPVSNGDGTFTVPFTVVVQNYGDVPLTNLVVTDVLSSVFGGALVGVNTLAVASGSAASVTANGGFDGSSATNLAGAGSSLGVGAKATFTFNVVIRPTPSSASFGNTVTAQGLSPSGSTVSDASVSGSDPNPTPGTPPSDDASPSSISFGTFTGHVFNDLNGDGIQQPDEPDLSGRTVTITPPTGTAFTVTTDAGGNYTATVPAGSATANVTDPIGSALTTGNDPQTLTVTGGANTTAAPVGFQARGTVTGHLFQDTNGDGAQQAGEPNLNGVPVRITDSLGQLQTAITDANGNYSASVPVGSTTANVTDPTGTILTTANDPQTLNVPAGSTTPTAPVGFQPRGGVSGHVFTDLNGDGIQQPGEPDTVGATVTITDSLGQIQTITTDANGNYNATVPTGSTTVNVTDPSGNVLTTANDPQTVNVGSSGGTATPVGFQPRGTVNGHVFTDTNNNGIQDAGEPDISGATVTITPVNGAPFTVTTDANGSYSASVPAGSVSVKVTDPTGTVLTSANNPQTLIVPTGASATAQPVGYRADSGSLTGVVFNDLDGDGVQSPNEPGIAGATITVVDADGVSHTVKTDANGRYSLSVPSGPSKITVTDPSGFVLTTNNNPQTITVVGGSATAAPVGYAKPSLTLEKAALNPTVTPGGTLGYRLTVHNTGPVALDQVKLVDALPQGLTYTKGSSKIGGTAIADPTIEIKDGRQTLTWTLPTSLPSGTNLSLEFSTNATAALPEGQIMNRATASASAGTGGTVVAVNSNAAVAAAKVVPGVFNSRTVIVGRVYFDLNDNLSFEDGTDKPLEGARVYLSDGRSAVTDALGRYSFPDVTPGLYVVRLDPLTAPYAPKHVPDDQGLLGTRYARTEVGGGIQTEDFPLERPAGAAVKSRSTTVEVGAVTLTKTLQRGGAGYGITLSLTVTAPVTKLTITDPLPDGATRGPIEIVASDGSVRAAPLSSDGLGILLGELQPGTYTIRYALFSNLPPELVVTDPDITYDPPGSSGNSSPSGVHDADPSLPSDTPTRVIDNEVNR